MKPAGTVVEAGGHSRPGSRVSTVVGNIADRINAELLSWPGVSAEPHRFGGIEYRFGRKEMGHVHGDRLADLPFPRAIRDRLIADGRADPHHVLPQTGWVSRWIESEAEAPEAIALFRLNYKRYLKAGTRK